MGKQYFLLPRWFVKERINRCRRRKRFPSVGIDRGNRGWRTLRWITFCALHFYFCTNLVELVADLMVVGNVLYGTSGGLETKLVVVYISFKEESKFSKGVESTCAFEGLPKKF